MACRVIVVEDEVIIAMMLTRMVERLGCQVIASFDNSDQAEREISDLQPNLIFMDINIDGSRNGIQLASDLVAKQPDLRIVFLTASTDDATQAAALAVKPLAFLRKPVELVDLANILSVMDLSGDCNGRICTHG